MATLKAFDHLLHDIVRGKRISQSKMDQISEMTMQLVQNDTNLVAGLYKAHMAAKDSTQKINSLYVFDNIARAARSAAKKNNQSIKELAPDKPGNAGSLLFKMQGILDSIIQDMVSSAAQEPMEKALKVIRIWVKAKTFPSAVLSPLEQSVESALQGLKEPEPELPTEPSASTSDVDQSNFPASLLALLGAAAQINPQSGSQTPIPVMSSSDAQNASIALLQQLAAHNQATGAGAPSSVSFDPHRQSYDSYATSPPYNMASSSHDQGSRRIPGDERSRFSPRGRDSNGRNDWRDSQRRSSRSRSPPPRVTNTRDPRLAGTTNGAGASSSSIHNDHNSTVLNPISTTTGNGSSEEKGQVGGHEQGAKIVSPATAQSVPEMGASRGVVGVGGGGSLESYDLSNFDTTSPEAWKRLSEAFIVTHARAPTQEELMNFVASKTVASAQPIPSLVTQQYPYQRMAFIPDPPRQIVAWETREIDEQKRGPSLRHLGHGSYDSLGLGHVGYGPERTDHTDAIVLCGSLETGL